MKIQENSKKFNIFLQILMCFFIEIWPKNDILTQKKLRKIPGIQPINEPSNDYGLKILSVFKYTKAELP